MIFGDDVLTPASADAAAWLAGACRGRWGSVGALVPNDFASYARVHAPPPDGEDWWDAYRSLFDVVSNVAVRHTSTPDRTWFAVWEGYGWDTSTTLYAVRGTLDRVRRRGMKAAQARAREADRRRHETVRSALSVVPRFELPHRGYYLVSGPVRAASDLREPGAPERWQRPDLVWPDDRAWFVATDVDFWSLYVGGTASFVDDLIGAVPTEADLVTLDQQLEAEI